MGSPFGQTREPLQLYNSLSRRVEPFRLTLAPVTVYVCGITPYATTHLGHAFTYATADILIRFLEDQGGRVRYVQNLTDIDDAILREAHQVGENWRELGNRWTEHFIQEMQTLNIRPPDLFPRATDVIPDIIATVRQLVAAGVAYVAGGSVYFHVDAWPSYGRLSRIPRNQMLPIANERGNHPDDPHKHDPLEMIPRLRYRHPHDPSHVADHILSSLIGPCLTVPVEGGELSLGTWQRIVLLEFDGPRARELVLAVVVES